MSAGNLNGAVRNIIDKGAVVTHQNDSSRTVFQKSFQPLDTLDIEVVGRLVEQQNIRPAQQQFSQLNTHTPSSTELGSRTVEVTPFKSQSDECPLYFGTVIGTSHHQEMLVIVRKAFDQLLIALRIIIGPVGQFLVHPVETLLHLEDMFKCHLGLFHHRTGIAQHHHLRQIAYRNVPLHSYRTLGRALFTRQNLQHGRLAGTVFTDQGYAVFLIDDKRNIFKQRCYTKLNFQSFYGNHAQ